MEDQHPVQLIVMGNSKSQATNIQGVFDLKGSLVNRFCKVPKEGFKATQTLKDKNLLTAKRFWLNFRDSDRKQILNTLK
jgi:1-phosphatidylinositol-4-phosphate 5-kinase